LEEGLGAVTLRGVAARIGVASGLVAHYEPSMEDLVARTFDRVALDEFGEVVADVTSRPSPTEQLAALLTTLLDDARDDVSSVWADAWSLGRRMPLLAAAARSRMDAWHSFGTALVRAGVDGGQFLTEEPEAVALELFALVDSTTAYALVGYSTPAKRANLVRNSLETSLGLARGTLTR
jgi:AcrR family transcriptional regulator